MADERARIDALLHGIIDNVDAITAELDTVDLVPKTEPEPPEPPITGAIATEAALDAALAAAAPGATLDLDPALTYTKRLQVSGVTLRSTVAPEGRMTKDAPAPLFTHAITLGDDATLIGLDLRNSDLVDVVVVTGARVTLDQCRILGDPVQGTKRGIAANGNGQCVIRRCYIDDCFRQGQDAQAICGWNFLPGLLIEDNYLCGGAETIMIGGSDPSSPERDPKDITIRGNTITKNPAWYGQDIVLKNTLELKNARNCLIEDNDISYSWAQGQDGYLIVITVRNDDEHNPTATIQDVVFRHNTCAHGAGAFNILGLDNLAPSIRMARVTISENYFTDLDGPTYAPGKTYRTILLNEIGDDLVITGNTFEGVKSSSAVYFVGGPPALRMVFTNNDVPNSKYGMFGQNCTAMATNWTETNSAWQRYTTGGTIANTTVAPATAADPPDDKIPD
jgi:hypothetical protein